MELFVSELMLDWFSHIQTFFLFFFCINQSFIFFFPCQRYGHMFAALMRECPNEQTHSHSFSLSFPLSLSLSLSLSHTHTDSHTSTRTHTRTDIPHIPYETLMLYSYLTHTYTHTHTHSHTHSCTRIRTLQKNILSHWYIFFDPLVSSFGNIESKLKQNEKRGKKNLMFFSVQHLVSYTSYFSQWNNQNRVQ